MSVESFTVLLAEDHPLMGDALARLVELDDSLELVARCADGEATLAAIRDRTPDVAILDVTMPGRNGPDVAAAVRGAGLSTRILFVTGHDDPETLDRCRAAGAQGFVSKAETNDKIRGAIRAVAAGREAFPHVVRPVVTPDRELVERGALLTLQERRVLALAAEGRSTAAIAGELYIAQTTVKTHLRNAAQKLGVRGKTAASATALRHGFIK